MFDLPQAHATLLNEQRTMSGYTGDRVAQDGWAEVGVVFLSKPFCRADLAQIVRTTLDSTG